MDNIDYFNGLSIECISRRMVPCPDKTLFYDWKYSCSRGWIRGNESFLQIIERDRKVLHNIGITSKQLCLILCKLVIYLKEINILLDNFTPFTWNGQSFEARKSWFISPQYSPFWNNDRIDSPFNVKWNVEWKIRNCTNGLSFILSGDEQGGIASLIGDFCFFEGGYGDEQGGGIAW